MIMMRNSPPQELTAATTALDTYDRILQKKAYKYMTAARLNMKQSVVGES